MTEIIQTRELPDCLLYSTEDMTYLAPLMDKDVASQYLAEFVGCDIELIQIALNDLYSAALMAHVYRGVVE